ncbi:MAG: hypothetical protein ABH858_01705 [Candidatus Omnitrophota bacterium]
MINYSSKYLISLVSSLIIFAVSAAALISYTINNTLLSSNEAIENTIGQKLKKNVSIEKIKYIPPNTIVLTRLSITDSRERDKIPLVSVEESKFTFSFLEAVKKRKVAITGIYLSGLRGDYNYLMSLLKENLKEIISFLKSSIRQENLILSVNKTSLVLTRENGCASYLSFDSKLRIKKDLLSVDGSLKTVKEFERDTNYKNRREIKETPPFSYHFSGHFGKEHFSIEKFECRSDGLYAKIWGKIEDNDIKLNGFASPINFMAKADTQKPGFNIKKKINNLLYKIRLFRKITKLSSSEINIFDIDCSATIALPEIEIKNLTFSLNNIPIAFKGTFFLLSPILIDLSLSSYPDYAAHSGLIPNDKFDIKLKGNVDNYRFNGNLDFDYTIEAKDKNTPQKTTSSFVNLSFAINQKQGLAISCDNLNTTYIQDNYIHEIFLSGFNMSSKLKEKRILSIILRSKIYDGIMEGKGSMDLTKTPFNTKFDFTINNVSADKLNNMLIYFPGVYGPCSAKISYKNHPQSEISGDITIDNGLLDNLRFLKWLGDFLSIDSVKKLAVDNLSSDFILNKKFLHFSKISIDSKDVTAKGYFTLYENKLISSRISLGLSRELLKDSPKFRRLINYLNPDTPSLVLDFQLSGSLGAVNFKWLDSDFRRKIKKLIPDFIERQLEGKVEENIRSISSQGTN